jgi:hypothetical protein
MSDNNNYRSTEKNTNDLSKTQEVLYNHDFKMADHAGGSREEAEVIAKQVAKNNTKD